MKFEKYHCQNGFAKPVNPFTKTTPQFAGNADHDWFKSVNLKWSVFEVFAQLNTVSCSEDLSGEYKVESVNILWRYKTKKDVWFFYKDQSVFDGSYERYRVYMIEEMNCVECDKYLQLKPVVKEPEFNYPEFGVIKNTGLSTNDDKCCGRCIKGLDTCTLDKEPKVKQQFGEWISVDNEIPKERQKVLALNKYGFIRQADWEQYTDQNKDWFEISFTHWMPCPALPQLHKSI